MQLLQIHHYGFLTGDAVGWLKESELVFGEPYKIFPSIAISTQQVNITFVEQTKGVPLVELVEPWKENYKLQQMLDKGTTLYHTGYIAPVKSFDKMMKSFEDKGMHLLMPFASEAFDNKRCVFIITENLGVIEIIEQ